MSTGVVAAAAVVQQTNMVDLCDELDHNNNNNNNLVCDLNNNNNGHVVVKASMPSFVKKEKVVITSISKTNLYMRGLDERKK
jgi:hypothetical protein